MAFSVLLSVLAIDCLKVLTNAELEGDEQLMFDVIVTATHGYHDNHR